jgi:hypothetical protein
VCRYARSAQRATPTLAPNYPKANQKATNYRLRKLQQKNSPRQVPGREDPAASHHVPYLGQAPKGETPNLGSYLAGVEGVRTNRAKQARRKRAKRAKAQLRAKRAQHQSTQGDIQLKFMSPGENTVEPIERSEQGTHKRAKRAHQQDDRNELRGQR